MGKNLLLVLKSLIKFTEKVKCRISLNSDDLGHNESLTTYFHFEIFLPLGGNGGRQDLDEDKSVI